MISNWYRHSSRHHCEYFISEYGWCITYSLPNPKVRLYKYNSLYNFIIVKSSKLISNNNYDLMHHLFEYGWMDSDAQNEYDGDFFK